MHKFIFFLCVAATMPFYGFFFDRYDMCGLKTARCIHSVHCISDIYEFYHQPEQLQRLKHELVPLIVRAFALDNCDDHPLYIRIKTYFETSIDDTSLVVNVCGLFGDHENLGHYESSWRRRMFAIFLDVCNVEWDELLQDAYLRIVDHTVANAHLMCWIAREVGFWTSQWSRAKDTDACDERDEPPGSRPPDYWDFVWGNSHDDK